MIIQHSLNTILKEHVTLEVESIDRMYLNVYIPRLQTEAGVANFFKKHRGALFASSALMEPMSNAFRKAIDVFTQKDRVPFIAFARSSARTISLRSTWQIRWQTGRALCRQSPGEGEGLSHRKAPLCRERQGLSLDCALHCHGQSLLFLLCRRGLRPLLPQVLRLLPYTAKLCINGHEYLKRQLQKEGIGF